MAENVVIHSLSEVAQNLASYSPHMRQALLVELLDMVEKQLEDEIKARTFLRALADRINFRLREGKWLV